MARSSILYMLLIVAGLSLFAQERKATAKPPVPTSDSDKELQLRFRLNRNAHDQQAHKQLVDLLNSRNAFRAELEEDGNWLKNNPDDYVAETAMSAWSETLQDPEYAIRIDQIVLANANRHDDPDDYDRVGDRLAFLLVKRARFAEALALLDKATRESPNDAGVWQNLAEAQYKAGRYHEAIENYRKSLDIDSNQEGTHEELAEALLKMGDIQSAETEMTASISVYNAQYNSGGNPTDSAHAFIKKMKDIEKSDRDLAKLRVKLAKLYIADKRYDDALNQADQAIQADSTEFSYHYFRAEVLDAMNQPKKAEVERESVRKLIVAEAAKEKHRDDMLSKFTYPEELFMMDPGSDEELIDGAHELILLLGPLSSTGKLKAWDQLLLGTAYCDHGDSVKCRQLVEASFQTDPTMSTSRTHYSLAQKLEKNNDMAGAAAHYQRAYELEPQNKTFRYDFETHRKFLSHPQA